MMLMRKVLIAGVFVLLPTSLHAAKFSFAGNSYFEGAFGETKGLFFILRNASLGGEGVLRPYLKIAGTLDINPQAPIFYPQIVTSISLTNVSPGGIAGLREIFSVLRLKSAYIETRGLPFFKIKFGRFPVDLGFSNSENFFERPLAERPLFIKRFFGIHGYIDNGIDISLAVPTPWWFELKTQILDGSEYNSFGSFGPWDLVYIVAVKHKFGKGPASGGVEGLAGFGKNWTQGGCVYDTDKKEWKCYNWTDMFGGGTYFTWRRGEQKILWRVEYLIRRKQAPEALDIEGGFYSDIVVFPISFAGFSLRPDFFGLPRRHKYGETTKKLPLIFGMNVGVNFVVNPKAKFRLQWTGEFPEKDRSSNYIILQATFKL